MLSIQNNTEFDFLDCPNGLNHDPITTDFGDIVCRNCGIILDKVMVNYFERAFTVEEMEKRIHGELNPLLGDTLNPKFDDIKNHIITSRQIMKYNKLRKIGSWVDNNGRQNSRIRRIIARLYKIASL